MIQVDLKVYTINASTYNIDAKVSKCAIARRM